MLQNHKFQFIRFCNAQITERCDGGLLIYDDSAILHIIKGTGTITIENQKHYFKKGTIIAVPLLTEFFFQVNSEFETMNIHYMMWRADGEHLDNVAILPFTFNPGNFNRIEQHLQTIRALSVQDKEISALVHAVVLEHMLHTEMQPRFPDNIDQRITAVTGLLKSDQYHQYNAREIADQCCLSISQMNRLFKKYYGLSPQKFWEKHRFSKICLILGKSELAVAEIAQDFGFDDHAYFSRWFKKKAGVSPAFYRKKKKKGNFSSFL